MCMDTHTDIHIHFYFENAAGELSFKRHSHFKQTIVYFFSYQTSLPVSALS